MEKLGWKWQLSSCLGCSPYAVAGMRQHSQCSFFVHTSCRRRRRHRHRSRRRHSHYPNDYLQGAVVVVAVVVVALSVRQIQGRARCGYLRAIMNLDKYPQKNTDNRSAHGAFSPLSLDDTRRCVLGMQEIGDFFME